MTTINQKPKFGRFYDVLLKILTLIFFVLLITVLLLEIFGPKSEPTSTTAPTIIVELRTNGIQPTSIIDPKIESKTESKNESKTESKTENQTSKTENQTSTTENQK